MEWASTYAGIDDAAARTARLQRAHNLPPRSVLRERFDTTFAARQQLDAVAGLVVGLHGGLMRRCGYYDLTID